MLDIYSLLDSILVDFCEKHFHLPEKIIKLRKEMNWNIIVEYDSKEILIEDPVPYTGTAGESIFDSVFYKKTIKLNYSKYLKLKEPLDILLFLELKK